MATAEAYANSTSGLGRTHAAFIGNFLEGISGWTLVLTAVVVLLAAEQWRYRLRKGTAAGPTWTIPLMGSFLDSMHPTFEGYYR